MIRPMEASNNYIDFLKNKRFIRWQLTPDETLEKYWREYIVQHPESEEAVQKAIQFLKTEGLNKKRLNKVEKRSLLDRIQRSTLADAKKKLKKRRLIRIYIAAAAAITLLIGLGYYFSQDEISSSSGMKGVIVGKILSNQNIQLIVGSDSLTFSKDVQVEVNQNGETKIIHGNGSKKTLGLAHNAPYKLIVPYGKRSTLKLSDGSKLWLNSGSKLEFPSQFSSNSREIKLLFGEMYIEVAPEAKKPFLVQTDNFQVEVLGTKFDVSAYDDAPHAIVLAGGSVRLKAVNKEEVLLKPNERAVFSNNGKFNEKQVDVNQFTSWKDGYLTFDKTPMSKVLKKIERYYNVSFNYNDDVDLQNRTCTGKIYLSENLGNVMTAISLLTATKYEQHNHRIYLEN